MALRNGGLFAVRPTDADGLDDVDGSASCNWTGWASARYLFPVNTSAMIEARASDGRRLEGPPPHITATATPSGTYVEMRAPEAAGCIASTTRRLTFLRVPGSRPPGLVALVAMVDAPAAPRANGCATCRRLDEQQRMPAAACGTRHPHGKDWSLREISHSTLGHRDRRGFPICTHQRTLQRDFAHRSRSVNRTRVSARYGGSIARR